MIEKLWRGLIITGIFLLPCVVFYVAYANFFPYITGKNFYFRVDVEIITALWLGLALVYPHNRPRKTWVMGAFALFAIIVAIADAQGAAPFKSFWSNFERMDGWITLGHLMLYAMVSSAILNTEKMWDWLFNWNVFLSMLVSLYGFFQIAGKIGIGQPTGTGLSARIDATFGNPIYLAAYMLFNVFFAAMLLMRVIEKKDKGERMPYILLYGAAIIIDTIVLLLTGTRGTIVGLVGGAFVAALLYFAFSHSVKHAWRVVVGIIAVVVIASGSLYMARDTEFVKGVAFLQRLASISIFEGTVKARFMNWGMAWQGVKERPVLGWGQENYAIVFDKYYDPNMYANEPWFDRVHNIIFDWLVAAGFVGLLSYLSIFAAMWFAVWRTKTPKGDRVFSYSEASLLTGLLGGYFFHNLFVFDNVTSYILYATVIAYIAWRTGDGTNAHRVFDKFSLPKAILPVTAVASLVLAAGSVWLISGKAYAQNQSLIRALALDGQPNKQLVYDAFKQALSVRSVGTQEGREQFIQHATQLAQSQNVPVDIRQKFLNDAAQEMTLQSNDSPLDARFPLFLGILLESYGNFPAAQTALDKAVQLSPTKQSILIQRAQNELLISKPDDALADLKKAFELAPQNSDARLVYASVAIQQGKFDLADELLAPVIPTGEAINQRVAAAYASKNRFDKIEAIWEQYLTTHTTDAQAFFTLAAAYNQAGNKQKAIETLTRAKTAMPQIEKQADEFIAQIKSGKK